MRWQRWIIVALVVVTGALLQAHLQAKPPGSGIVALAHQGSTLWAVAADGTIYRSAQDTDGFAGGPFQVVGHVSGVPVDIAVDNGAGDIYVALSNGDVYWTLYNTPPPFNFTLRRNILTP